MKMSAYVSLTKRLPIVATMVMLSACTAWANRARMQDGPVLWIEAPELAGLDDREPDKSFPGANVVDAVHRSVVVRFPSAARVLEPWVAKGYTVTSASLILNYDGYETNPVGYVSRTALVEKRWAEDPPDWHVVAWALKRSWSLGTRAPTANASEKGRTYWSHYGATADGVDRHSRRFGPEVLSIRHPMVNLDISAVLRDEAFGATLRNRAYLVTHRGFLIRKLEVYDSRYRERNNAYE